MKRFLLLTLTCSFFFLILQTPIKGETEFEFYLGDFYKKQELASQMLREIEKDLKIGSREKVCARQREAAKYGIEATHSLIKAFKINGSTTEIESLQAGLNKWKELRDYC